MSDLLLTVRGFADRRGAEFDPTDVAALRAVQDASAFIRRYTGQEITEVLGDVMTLDGTGRYGLMLPQLPVTAITEVSEVDSEGVETVLEATTYRADSSGILWRLDGDSWCEGHANVLVTCDHGYATVPDDILLACFDLALANFGSASLGGGAVTSKQIGTFQVTYDASSTVSEGGLPKATKTILDFYRVAK